MAPAATGQPKRPRRPTKHEGQTAKRTPTPGPVQNVKRAVPVRLGRRLSTTEEVRAVQAGVPVALAREIQQEAGLTLEGLSTVLGIPRRTLINHMKQTHFDVDESDRVIRFKRVLERATDTFEGDGQAALAWLKSPNRALGGASPMDLVSTGAGARAVEQALGRMEHSLYS